MAYILLHMAARGKAQDSWMGVDANSHRCNVLPFECFGSATPIPQPGILRASERETQELRVNKAMTKKISNSERCYWSQGPSVPNIHAPNVHTMESSLIRRMRQWGISLKAERRI